MDCAGMSVQVRTKEQTEVLRIIERCEADFWYFLRTFCKVVAKTDSVSRRRGLVLFEPWKEQIEVVNALMTNDQIYVLKAQIGRAHV